MRGREERLGFGFEQRLISPLVQCLCFTFDFSFFGHVGRLCGRLKGKPTKPS